MNDNLGDKLSGLVPDLATDNLISGMHAKRRRQSAWRAAGVAGVLVAIIMPLAYWSTGQPDGIASPAATASPSETPDPGPSSSAPSTPEQVPPGNGNPCDEKSVFNMVDDAIPEEGLEQGAARVWLCGDVAQGMVGPLEPLTENPDRVVRAANTSGRLEPNAACQADAGPSYAVVIEYPESREVTLRGGLFGCQELGQTRRGADQFLDSLRNFWTTQRRNEAEPPGFVTSRKPCSRFVANAMANPGLDDNTGGLGQRGWSSLMLVDEHSAETGVICGFRKGTTEFTPDNVLAIDIPESFLPAVIEGVNDLNAEPHYPGTWAGLPYLELMNSYGDPIMLSLPNPDGMVTRQHGGVVQIDPAAAEELRALLDQFQVEPWPN